MVICEMKVINRLLKCSVTGEAAVDRVATRRRGHKTRPSGEKEPDAGRRGKENKQRQ